MDWDLLEQEMDTHLATDPVLQRAARGEPVTASELDRWWQRAIIAFFVVLLVVSIGYGLGMLLPV